MAASNSSLTADGDRIASVSVIVPAHNAAGTIDCAVRSALHQDSVTVELIICDDASTDDTVSTVRALEQDGIRLIANEVNLGPGPSRDLALHEASSEWVALLDADDAFGAGRLWRLIDAADRLNADVVFDDTMLCHDTVSGMKPWKRLHGPNAYGGMGAEPRNVRIEDYIASGRLLIQPVLRTAFIRKHHIRHSSRRFAEDAEFYLRLAHAGARFCYFPQPLYLYRITPGSLTDQARDPSLMRQCLEECAQWEGWSPSARAAFDIKIASLHRNEAAYALARLVRSGRMAAAARLLTSQPHLLRSLPPKLLERVGYHAHRLLHGGRRR